jgi:transposase
LIDSSIRQDIDNWEVSIGLICKALILNGLGFVQRRLYLVSHFFSDKPTELLLGAGIEGSHLNDSVIGRALDALHDYGTTRLFTTLAAHAAQVLGLDSRFGHIDTTSFHLDGAYNKEAPADDERIIHITQGYSRDHRPDLNQVVLSLIAENQAGIPIHMEVLNGNRDDKTSFRETIHAHIDQLQGIHQLEYVVADSALYTSKSIGLLSGKTGWISRVPATLTEARQVIDAADRFQMLPLAQGYLYLPLCSDYAGVKQRWLLIWSEQAWKRELEGLEKNYANTSHQDAREFEKLCRQEFSCAGDAQKALEAFQKDCTFIHIKDGHVVQTAKYAGKGRPKNDSSPLAYSYSPAGSVSCEIAHFQELANSKGKFILATNQLDQGALSDADVLAAYKEQSKVERGFRFLKDPQFAATQLFVKKPQRLEALVMIMTLCLMVYAALEYKLRNALKEEAVKLPDQTGKLISNPTIRWVFALFSGIHILYTDNQTICLNFKEINKTVIQLMGPKYKKYYLRE